MGKELQSKLEDIVKILNADKDITDNLSFYSVQYDQQTKNCFVHIVDNDMKDEIDKDIVRYEIINWKGKFEVLLHSQKVDKYMTSDGLKECRDIFHNSFNGLNDNKLELSSIYNEDGSANKN